MMTRRSVPQTGFTLLEMVVSLLLVSIVAVLAAQILITGFQAWTAGRVMVPMVAQGRLAMEWMTRDLQMAVVASMNVAPDTKSMVFNDSKGILLGYDQVPPAGQPASAIYRSFNGQKNLLADHVRADSLRLNWDNSRHLITMAFTLEASLFHAAEPIQIPLQTTVYVRN